MVRGVGTLLSARLLRLLGWIVLTKACRLLDIIVLKHITLPSLNKWTKVQPVICGVLLLCSFGLVARALTKVLGLDNTHQPEDEGEEDLHVHVDPRAATKRAVRTVNFLTHPRTPARLLLWVVVAEPIVALHYHLFKHVRFANHRSKEHRSAVVWCSPTLQNPAFRALGEVHNLLTQVDHKHWQLTRQVHGRSTCYTEWWTMARRAAYITLGSLSRRLIHMFQRWPWPLAQLVDPSLDKQTKVTVAKRFFKVKECCLDNAFSRRLRARYPNHSWEVCFSPEVQHVLHMAFSRTLLTSTFVERIFANLTKWTSLRHHGADLLAAKHMTGCLKTVQQLLASRTPKLTRRATARSRPAWVKKSSHLTGLHLFCSQASTDSASASPADSWKRIQHAQKQWRDLPPRQKTFWRMQARAKRSRSGEGQHSTASDAVLGSPPNHSASSMHIVAGCDPGSICPVHASTSMEPGIPLSDEVYESPSRQTRSLLGTLQFLAAGACVATPP